MSLLFPTYIQEHIQEPAHKGVLRDYISIYIETDYNSICSSDQNVLICATMLHMYLYIHRDAYNLQ